MSRVRKQGALPLQHVCHTFQEVQKAKGQSCLSQPVKFLQRTKTPFIQSLMVALKRYVFIFLIFKCKLIQLEENNLC